MNSIQQIGILNEIVEKYPYMVIFGKIRTTTLDGDYDFPIYFQTFEHAYYYICNLYNVKKYMSNIIVDTLYINNNFEDKEDNNDKKYYYLLSLEKALDLFNCNISNDQYKYVYKSPNVNIIYYSTIKKTNIIEYYNNRICNLIPKDKYVKLLYLGLYLVNNEIIINGHNEIIEFIDQCYPHTDLITQIPCSKGRFKSFIQNISDSSFKNIFLRFLKNSNICLVNENIDLVDKIQNKEIYYLGIEDLKDNSELNINLIFQELIIR